ncbi:MAG: aminotransferase class IV [Anaerolineales bacterium]|uniref:aminotransferase class IV n=1 Tax=Candidatus Villigracilis vicinus TaxID=3140679 RepID=UPI003135AF7B|nr:aminotransferase class IV [Anaerolineales bacterium]
MNTQGFHLTGSLAVPLDFNASTLDEITVQLSDGFYTTFSTLNGGTKVLGLQAHLNRLFLPAKEQGLQPSVDEITLRRHIVEAVHQYSPNEVRIRLVLTKDTGDVYLGIQAFTPSPADIYEKGVHVITVIKGKNLITAQKGILLGVTRRAVLRLARGEGMSIDYRSPRVDEKFNEAFITSSSRGVVPIISIDEKNVGEGGVGEWTKKLSLAYQAYVHNKSEDICS